MTRPFESPDDALRRLVELHVRSCDLVRHLADLEAASAQVKEALAPAVPPGRPKLVLVEVEYVREPGEPGGSRWTTYLVRLTRRGDTLGCEVTEIDESETLRWPEEDEVMGRRLAEMAAAPGRVAPAPAPPREVGAHAVEVGGELDPLGDCPPEDFSAANARRFIDVDDVGRAVGRALAQVFDLPAAPPDPTGDLELIDSESA
jgi:hypothetical protein